MIRPVKTDDSEAIAGIYNHYIANSIVTFEEQAVSTEDMSQRIAESSSEGLPWLVAEDSNRITGFAYASKWKGRCAYRHSVESTVYLDPSAMRVGFGSLLYERLLADLKHLDIHVVIGGIALPNLASIALHEKFGFTKVAHFNEVGFKFDKWVDVGYWQKTL